MIPFIRVNGKEMFEKVSEFQFGKMVLVTKDIGKMINLVDQESTIIMKVTYIKVNLKTVKRTDMEYIIAKMEHNLMVNFEMDKNME